MKLLAILLTVLFTGLKLTNFITWSWWLVLSPMLALIAFSLIMFILLMVMVN